jgi:hypothetical protein
MRALVPGCTAKTAETQQQLGAPRKTTAAASTWEAQAVLRGAFDENKVVMCYKYFLGNVFFSASVSDETDDKSAMSSGRRVSARLLPKTAGARGAGDKPWDWGGVSHLLTVAFSQTNLRNREWNATKMVRIAQRHDEV